MKERYKALCSEVRCIMPCVTYTGDLDGLRWELRRIFADRSIPTRLKVAVIDYAVMLFTDGWIPF